MVLDLTHPEQALRPMGVAETPPIGQEAGTGVEACLVPPLPRRVSPCPSCFPLGNPGLGVAGNPKKQKLTLEPPVGAASWLPHLSSLRLRELTVVSLPFVASFVKGREGHGFYLPKSRIESACLNVASRPRDVLAENTPLTVSRDYVPENV